jgi:hypothetical protein
MGLTDYAKRINEATTIAPAAARTTGTITGTTVDTANYGGVTLFTHVGVITDGTHTLSIEEGNAANMSDAAAVAAADLVGSVGALVSGTNVEVGYIGTKRYIRAKVVVTGTTSGGFYDTVVLLHGARVQPA